MRRDESCIFCQIVAGQLPSDTVFQNDLIVAFRDIQPVAPVHVVVVPREHIASLSALQDCDDVISASLLAAARDVAAQQGIEQDGYRVVTNIGTNGGQSVDHLHLHVLGGRQLGSLG